MRDYILLIDNTFVRMEHAVIQMLIQRDNENLDILTEQYKNATIVERNFTGSVFFTEYSVPAQVRRLEEASKFPLGTVMGKIWDAGLEVNVGFLLFFKNGVIDFLECYECDDAPFPEEVEHFTLWYHFFG